MTTTAKKKEAAKSKEARVTEVTTLLAHLSERDLAAVESMVKSRQPQEDIETVLATPEGQELIKQLKTLKGTKIYFELTQLKSIDRQVSLTWEVPDPEFYPHVEDTTSRGSSPIAAEIFDILQEEVNNNYGDGNDCDLLPAKVRQEVAKDQARLESALKTLGERETTFSLKDIPDLSQGTVCISFENLEFEGYGEGGFNPEFSWKSKKKRDSKLAYLLDVFSDDPGCLEEELPKELSTKLTNAYKLGEQIMDLAAKLEEKHPTWDVSDIVREGICQL